MTGLAFFFMTFEVRAAFSAQNNDFERTFYDLAGNESEKDGCVECRSDLEEWGKRIKVNGCSYVEGERAILTRM